MDAIIRDQTGRFLPGTAPGPGRPVNSRPRLVAALGEVLDEDETLERLRRMGSTPFSRTVELSLLLPSCVVRFFLLFLDCETVRCSRRHPLGPQPV